jgi:hypothetical protein
LEVNENGQFQVTFPAGDSAGTHHVEDCQPPTGAEATYRTIPLPVAGRAGIVHTAVSSGIARLAICSDAGALSGPHNMQVEAKDVSAGAHPYVAVLSTGPVNNVSVWWFVGYGDDLPYT